MSEKATAPRCVGPPPACAHRSASPLRVRTHRARNEGADAVRARALPSVPRSEVALSCHPSTHTPSHPKESRSVPCRLTASRLRLQLSPQTTTSTKTKQQTLLTCASPAASAAWGCHPPAPRQSRLDNRPFTSLPTASNPESTSSRSRCVHPQSCTPLRLTSPNGSVFEFKGVTPLLQNSTTAECLLTPPDAAGDESAAVSAAQLVNQVSHRPVTQPGSESSGSDAGRRVTMSEQAATRSPSHAMSMGLHTEIVSMGRHTERKSAAVGRLLPTASVVWLVRAAHMCVALLPRFPAPHIPQFLNRHPLHRPKYRPVTYRPTL